MIGLNGSIFLSSTQNFKKSCIIKSWDYSEYLTNPPESSHLTQISNSREEFQKYNPKVLVN